MLGDRKVRGIDADGRIEVEDACAGHHQVAVLLHDQCFRKEPPSHGVVQVEFEPEARFLDHRSSVTNTRVAGKGRALLSIYGLSPTLQFSTTVVGRADRAVDGARRRKRSPSGVT